MPSLSTFLDFLDFVKLLKRCYFKLYDFCELVAKKVKSTNESARICQKTTSSKKMQHPEENDNLTVLHLFQDRKHAIRYI